jgi:hypothetical protein
MSLSTIWNGEQHELIPGEDFSDTGATLVIEGFHTDPTAEDLDPFETPTATVELRETRTLPDDPRFPDRGVQQAWGALGVSLGAFCKVAEIGRDQYQENDHNAGTMRFLFTAKQPLGERI